MSEPDYEAIIAARDEERGQRWLERMDRQYGTVEAWLTGPRRRCACGKLWGDGQAAHGCRLLEPPP